MSFYEQLEKLCKMHDVKPSNIAQQLGMSKGSMSNLGNCETQNKLTENQKKKQKTRLDLNWRQKNKMTDI